MSLVYMLAPYDRQQVEVGCVDLRVDDNGNEGQKNVGWRMFMSLGLLPVEFGHARLLSSSVVACCTVTKALGSCQDDSSTPRTVVGRPMGAQTRQLRLH